MIFIRNILLFLIINDIIFLIITIFIDLNRIASKQLFIILYADFHPFYYYKIKFINPYGIT